MSDREDEEDEMDSRKEERQGVKSVKVPTDSAVREDCVRDRWACRARNQEDRSKSKGDTGLAIWWPRCLVHIIFREGFHGRV